MHRPTRHPTMFLCCGGPPAEAFSCVFYSGPQLPSARTSGLPSYQPRTRESASPQNAPVIRARFSATTLPLRSSEVSKCYGTLKSQSVRKSALADGKRKHDVPNVRKEHRVLHANGHLHRLARTEDRPRFRVCDSFLSFSANRNCSTTIPWRSGPALAACANVLPLLRSAHTKTLAKRMKVSLFRRCGPSTSPALQRCATCRYCSLEESRSNYTDCTPALYWTSWILATSIFKRLLRNSDANQGTAVEEGDGVDLIFCFSIPRRKTRPRRLQRPPSSTCALDICDSFLLSPVPGAIR